MTSPRILVPGQQFIALILATVLTSFVLLSLGAQAEHSHADALMAVQAGTGQQLCAAPARSARS